MEVGYAVIVVHNILPYRHGMILFAVEGAVYEFNLRHIIIEEKPKLSLNSVDVKKPQLFVGAG